MKMEIKGMGALLAAACLASAASLQGDEEITLREETTVVALGDRLDILISVRAIDGDVVVVGEDRPDVEIRIEGLDEDAESWELPRARFDEEAGMLSLTLGPQTDYDDVALRVPQAVSLRIDVKDGDATLIDVRGGIEVSTVDGEITLTRTSGGVVAHTVDGDIRMSLADTKLANPISLATVDGDIDLEAGESLSANVSVSTIDGEFESEFTLNREGRMKAIPWVGVNLQATIGQGGPSVSLKTIDGDVRIRKGD